MPGRWRSLWRELMARQTFEDGMSDELQFHMAEYADELVKRGVSQHEAMRRARLEFGGLNAVKEDCRSARGLFFFDQLQRQLRYALRVLRKSPAFTVTAVFTIALCLAANFTIFAVVDSVLLRPLPFPQPQRLVTLFNTYPKAGVDRDGSSITNYYERRGAIPAFRSVSMYRLSAAFTGEPGFTQREAIVEVSSDFFSTLGVGPVVGRVFEEGEMEPARDRAVIVTESYRRQHWSNDRAALGQSVRVNGKATTIVGVLPDGFGFLSSEARLYFPFVSAPGQRRASERHSGGNVTQMIARLHDGATIAQAQSQIDSQNKVLEADSEQGKRMADAGFRTVVVSLHGDHVASIRPTLLLLQCGVLLLLLIACANLASLHLVRAGARVREVAVRRALGASSGSVLGEVLTETLVLTLAGGLLGVLLASLGIRLLALLGADRLPLGAEIAFHFRVAVIAVLAAVAMGVALAAPTAWFSVRQHLNDALKSEGRGGTSGPAAQRLRHTFIALQVAFSFVLLAAAGLVGLSLQRAMAVSPGFVPGRVLSAQVSLVGNKYPSAATGLLFTERLVDDLIRQPGIATAGIVNNIPFSGYSGKSAATVKGYVLRAGDSPQGHYSYGVAGDYFRAMGLTLKVGRFLTAADSRRTERVCVVDEDFARHYWPHSDPIGRQLFQGSSAGAVSEAFTVVGVVGRVKQAGLTEAAGQGAVYYPYIYRPDSNLFVVVRTAPNPAALMGAQQTLRSSVKKIDPELAVTDMFSMDVRIEDSLVARRAPVVLGGFFAAIALLMTAIGTYGMVSYAVAQRRREISVRIALGAQSGQIRWHFLSLSLRLLGVGMTLGLAGILLAGNAVRSVLFDTQPYDPPTLLAAAAVVIVVSLCACLLPARRAASISPTEALGET